MNDFAITITPRFYETDAMGHINNASIAAWFEMVRITFLESLMSGTIGVDKNWILASIKLDFVAETFYGSDVTATMTSVSVGNSSLTLDSEMSQNNSVTVRAVAVLVHFDNVEKKTIRISDSMREMLAQL